MLPCTVLLDLVCQFFHVCIYIYIYIYTHTHTYGQLMYRCVDLLVWRKNVKKTKKNTYLVCMLLKKFCFIEGSRKHVVSVTLNGRSWTTRTLPKAGLLAKLSNWWRRALVRGVTKNLMVTLVELHDCICRWEKSTEGQTSLQHPIDLGFTAVWPNSTLSSV